MDPIVFGIDVLATLTLIGGVIAVALVIMVLWESLIGKRTSLMHWISMHALGLMLIVALTATLGSLFLSEIAGWTPCLLCWYQRIVMYPQTVILALAFWRKDRNVAIYILVLSLIGLLIAAGHYGEQIWAMLHPADPLTPCDDTGVSCARTYTFRYGYITVPMMALTAFVLNILGSTLLLRGRRS